MTQCASRIGQTSRAKSTAFALVKRNYAVIMAAGGLILIVMGVLIWTDSLGPINGDVQRFLNDHDINFFNI